VELGQTFDLSAEAYDAVRPGYPDALLDRALARGGLGPGARVLEVGCGTGKLTAMLVARGLHVDAVDPGPNMISVARRRLGPAVAFHLGRFEEVDLAGDFDAVFSATAFHWVDPEVGWRKAAAHLPPGGLIALLAYMTYRDERTGPVQDEFLELIRKHAPEVSDQLQPFQALDVLLAGVDERRANASAVWDWLLQGGLRRRTLVTPDGADLFEDVEVATETSMVEETADEWLALFRTTALYQQVDPARREALEEDDRRLIEELGGTVSSPVAYVLMTALRT
jgi:SAM-dependent methyltransferase